MGELVPIDPDTRDALAQREADLLLRKQAIEVAARTRVSAADFKAALVTGAADLVAQVVDGTLKPRNADEATKVADRLLTMVNKLALVGLDDELAGITDPKVRAETLADFRRIAHERAAQSG